MKIVMLRHGTRQREDDPDCDEHLEKLLPLSSQGQLEVRERALDLKGLEISPDVYLTSCFLHSRQTGEILRDTLSHASVDVVELCTLTPHYQGPRGSRGNWRGVQMLEGITQESNFKRKNLRELDTVAFILHQPRLQQLLATMTSQGETQFSGIKYSEGFCIRAESIEAFLRGQGVVEAHVTSERTSGRV